MKTAGNYFLNCKFSDNIVDALHQSVSFTILYKQILLHFFLQQYHDTRP